MLRFALDPDAYPCVGRCSRKHNRRQPFQIIVVPAVANSCEIDVDRTADERLNFLVATLNGSLILLLDFLEPVGGQAGVRGPGYPRHHRMKKVRRGAVRVNRKLSGERKHQSPSSRLFSTRIGVRSCIRASPKCVCTSETPRIPNTRPAHLRARASSCHRQDNSASSSHPPSQRRGGRG